MEIVRLRSSSPQPNYGSVRCRPVGPDARGVGTPCRWPRPSVLSIRGPRSVVPGVQRPGRSGTEIGHNFRSALFPIGFSSMSRYPWWVRTLGYPGSLRRSSRSCRNTNLSQNGPVYLTLAETKATSNNINYSFQDAVLVLPYSCVTCSAAPGGHALPIPPGATLSKAKEQVSSRFVRFGKTRCERPRLARL